MTGCVALNRKKVQPEQSRVRNCWQATTIVQFLQSRMNTLYVRCLRRRRFAEGGREGGRGGKRARQGRKGIINTVSVVHLSTVRYASWSSPRNGRNSLMLFIQISACGLGNINELNKTFCSAALARKQNVP